LSSKGQGILVNFGGFKGVKKMDKVFAEGMLWGMLTGFGFSGLIAYLIYHFRKSRQI
jgi:tetrahydromethanopterin S-methyltransferase subunit B